MPFLDVVGHDTRQSSRRVAMSGEAPGVVFVAAARSRFGGDKQRRTTLKARDIIRTAESVHCKRASIKPTALRFDRCVSGDVHQELQFTLNTVALIIIH